MYVNKKQGDMTQQQQQEQEREQTNKERRGMRVCMKLCMFENYVCMSKTQRDRHATRNNNKRKERKKQVLHFVPFICTHVAGLFSFFVCVLLACLVLSIALLFSSVVYF
jgi:hypothetical protein